MQRLDRRNKDLKFQKVDVESMLAIFHMMESRLLVSTFITTITYECTMLSQDSSFIRIKETLTKSLTSPGLKKTENMIS